MNPLSKIPSLPSKIPTPLGWVLLVYGGLGVLLWAVPLFNLLHAESSAVVAGVAFFAAGLSSLVLFGRGARRLPGRLPRGGAFAFAVAVADAVAEAEAEAEAVAVAVAVAVTVAVAVAVAGAVAVAVAGAVVGASVGSSDSPPLNATISPIRMTDPIATPISAFGAWDTGASVAACLRSSLIITTIPIQRVVNGLLTRYRRIPFFL